MTTQNEIQQKVMAAIKYLRETGYMKRTRGDNDVWLFTIAIEGSSGKVLEAGPSPVRARCEDNVCEEKSGAGSKRGEECEEREDSGEGQREEEREKGERSQQTSILGLTNIPTLAPNQMYQPLADTLASIIKRYAHKHIPTQAKAAWCNEFRRLVETEGVNIQRVQRVMLWYDKNAFGEFVPVAESGKTFREKFTRLEAAMDRQQKDHVDRSAIDEAFSKFISVYPNKVGIKAAHMTFAGVFRELPPIEDLISIVLAHREQEQWQKDGGAFIPSAVKWLKEGRWEDPLPGTENNNSQRVKVRVGRA